MFMTFFTGIGVGVELVVIIVHYTLCIANGWDKYQILDASSIIE